jgi:biopolymer transport protein ExbB/TolQ
MLQLFFEGGALFMGILTLSLLAIISLAVMNVLKIKSDQDRNVQTMQHRLTYIKSVGLFSLVFGVLGQLIGLFTAFGTISKIGSVSSEILMAGIRVSMITTIYGVIIFLISYLIWFAMDHKVSNMNE